MVELEESEKLQVKSPEPELAQIAEIAEIAEIPEEQSV